MEDKRSIKKMLESQGTCTRSWRTNPIRNCRVRVQLGVQDHIVFKLTFILHTTSVLGVLHMHEKLGR
jgi:hypothetical protein